jgi:hypothetical protein
MPARADLPWRCSGDPMPRKKRQLAPAEFAAAVSNAVKANLEGTRPTNPNASHRDVRRVANGLALLKQLTDQQHAEMKARGDRNYRGTGVLDAIDILEALLTGCDHPIREHLEGLKSRRGSRPPTAFEEWRRGLVLGIVRALQSTGMSERGAVDLVICKYVFRAQGFQLRAEQIRGWPVNEALVGAAARTFIQEAEKLASPPSPPKLQDRILLAGFRWLQQSWDLAVAPVG